MPLYLYRSEKKLIIYKKLQEFLEASIFLPEFRNIYFTFINSTSKIKGAFGGMTPPAPRAP